MVANALQQAAGAARAALLPDDCLIGRPERRGSAAVARAARKQEGLGVPVRGCVGHHWTRGMPEAAYRTVRELRKKPGNGRGISGMRFLGAGGILLVGLYDSCD